MMAGGTEQTVAMNAAHVETMVVGWEGGGPGSREETNGGADVANPLEEAGIRGVCSGAGHSGGGRRSI